MGSMTFKIKPTARSINNYSNIIHFTANNQNYNSIGSRVPAVWFYSKSTRMHVRMGRPGKANDGCDPKEQLPLNKWSTFNLKLMGKTLTVSVDGKVLCVNNNYANSDPSYKNVKVYAADPWHRTAQASIKDFSYVDEDARVKKVAAAKRRARMAHLKKQRDARAKKAAAKARALKLARQAAAAKAARAKAIRIAKRKAAKAKAARLAREKAAREKAARLAVIRRRKLRMQRLHAEAKNDNTGRCYYGRSAYGGCEIGGKRGGNGGGHKVIVVKPTKPAKKAIKNSSQCAAMCKAKGHCCNDWTIGSNQMVSCAQACEMRLNGVSKQNCD